MKWYVVTVVLSIEVQKEKIAKLQTKQTVAVRYQNRPSGVRLSSEPRGARSFEGARGQAAPAPRAPRLPPGRRPAHARAGPPATRRVGEPVQVRSPGAAGGRSLSVGPSWQVCCEAAVASSAVRDVEA